MNAPAEKIPLNGVTFLHLNVPAIFFLYIFSVFKKAFYFSSATLNFFPSTPNPAFVRVEKKS